MRNIFIDMEKLRNLNSGLGQFCLNLGKSLASRQAGAGEIKLNFYVPSSCRGVFGSNYNYIFHSHLHKLFLPVSEKIDVWHCTHQESKYLPFSKKPAIILTIHDLNFLHKYSGVRRRNKLRALQKKVKKASCITVISNYTGKMVQEHLNPGTIPMKVIYNGNSLAVFPDPARPSFAPGGKFIFTLGIIEPKKNFRVLIPFLEKIKDYSLVIAGSQKGFFAREIGNLAEKLKVNGRLIMPGTVNAEEKYWLYKNCEAFVFPSQAEGFGLPVVEAMSCGKPVFLSDSSSLPEIGGEAAFYWNNFDADEMKKVFEQGINQFYSSPHYARKCVEHASFFSWDKAASEYLSLYRSL